MKELNEKDWTYIGILDFPNQTLNWHGQCSSQDYYAKRHHMTLPSYKTKEYKTLNEQQRVVFDTVLLSVTHSNGNIFALNACGGSGKTYTLNLILAAVRAQKKVALVTATSGIAATSLNNG